MAHVDAPGFSQSQQRRIADLVLGQRGGLRKIDAQLAAERFAWQVMALRVAAIACHARADVEPGALAFARNGRHAALRFGADWAAAHPRTLHQLHEEADAWSRLESPRLLLQPQP
jgi:exopolyphosphatase/guanosine-5'-triphosphate,3'-diphosphate pyrophosphatase